jgi:hypothetical protein
MDVEKILEEWDEGRSMKNWFREGDLNNEVDDGFQ